jgi:alpha-mannosidase
MQRFVTLRGGSKACTIFTYGLPEYEFIPDNEGTIAITLLRSVGVLAGDGLITRPGGKAGWHTLTPEAQCQGQHTFRYAVFPHAGDEEGCLAEINAQAELFHYPFMSVRRKSSVNGLSEKSLLEFSSRNVVLSAIKEAEDGNGYIVRWWNPANAAAENRLTAGFPVSSAAETNLRERTIKKIRERNGSFSINTNPCGISTLRLKP